MLFSKIFLVLALSTATLAKHSVNPPKDCTEMGDRIRKCETRNEWCPVIGCQDICIENECHKFDDWGNKNCSLLETTLKPNNINLESKINSKQLSTTTVILTLATTIFANDGSKPPAPVKSCDNIRNRVYDCINSVSNELGARLTVWYRWEGEFVRHQMAESRFKYFMFDSSQPPAARAIKLRDFTNWEPKPSHLWFATYPPLVAAVCTSKVTCNFNFKSDLNLTIMRMSFIAIVATMAAIVLAKHPKNPAPVTNCKQVKDKIYSCMNNPKDVSSSATNAVSLRHYWRTNVQESQVLEQCLRMLSPFILCLYRGLWLQELPH
ncbi:hypothetical protein T440DRAFT_481121 [Plenodomus tracheiphilus IPT5]|uniref:Uncharacterized protein n=1 Tax=Plenodomus tracheiphilus IPT5 TaxID=1408161 RepID=A0A6A7AYU0_9PLEO|nr:hypothetical protein T440DRAFT_481121 [Plenodomus tracheiphilus IPT5]